MSQKPTAALELTSHSPAETRSIGRKLGRMLKQGDVLLLQGNFGAGKTVMVQGIGTGLEVTDRIISPSFTLVNEYRTGKAHGFIPVYHADLYRISSVDEAFGLGLDEYLSGRGIFIAEWPENVPQVWPGEHLWITLKVTGDKERSIRMEARGARYIEILSKFEKLLKKDRKNDSSD